MPQLTPTTSKKFSVNQIDLLKGLAVAVLTDVFAVILEALKKGPLIFNWQVIGGVALAAFLGYISKNFLTPARIVITDPQTVKSVKEGEATVKVIEKKVPTKKSR